MAGMYYLGSGLSVGLGTPSLTILSDELKKSCNHIHILSIRYLIPSIMI